VTGPLNGSRPRIVVTGGPGAGKTTAVDIFRRELGERVVIVPEAGTILFAGGFPRSRIMTAQAAAQLAIYHTQRQLELAQAAIYPGRILLCDRGTVDGGAYWPDGPESYFERIGSSLEAELERYDAVVFFETAAAGGLDIEGNPVRLESPPEAVAVDRRLQALWSRHRDFTLVRHQPSFIRKLMLGLEAIQGRVAALADERD
jgi:predicted ATPase